MMKREEGCPKQIAEEGRIGQQEKGKNERPNTL